MDEQVERDEADATAHEAEPLRAVDPQAQPSRHVTGDPLDAPDSFAGTQPHEADAPYAAVDPFEEPATPSAEPADQGAFEPAPRPRYVRQRPPHRTQAAINDLEQDQGAPGYTHDSNVAVRGGAFSGGRQYRRSHGGMDQIQNSRYGQYLEVPKGRRSIFSARERARRRRSIATTVAVVAVIAVVVLVILHLVGA